MNSARLTRGHVPEWDDNYIERQISNSLIGLMKMVFGGDSDTRTQQKSKLRMKQSLLLHKSLWVRVVHFAKLSEILTSMKHTLATCLSKVKSQECPRKFFALYKWEH